MNSPQTNPDENWKTNYSVGNDSSWITKVNFKEVTSEMSN